MAKVLIVDDSSIILQVLSRQLVRAGYEVATSSIALGVLRVLLQEQPDLLILDITMPGLQVRSLCRMLRSREVLGVPVVLHSGLEEAELAQLASECGAPAYLHKAWNIDRKLEVLASLVGPLPLQTPQGGTVAPKLEAPSPPVGFTRRKS